jgi:cation diffusion facilitator CzcD-associated flavoprotein CzcO
LEEIMQKADAIVIGAGPSGLAVAAMLQADGLRAAVLEKAESVGSVWRRHYDRLHLHTDRGHSALPGLPMPSNYPRYPSRQQFLDYLETYRAKFDLKPIFGARVSAIRRDGQGWRAEAGHDVWSAPIAVVATGWADFPRIPTWAGQELFEGEILHSSAYRNPSPYGGKRVLVVGFGNSGGEIALDLAEANIDVTLAVRGPVRIIPRDLLGIPIVTWAIMQRHLPARVSDALDAPFIRLAVGSIEKLGMKRALKGPRRMIEEDGRVPLLDVGTVAKIRSGAIKVRGAIAKFTAEGVAFAETAPERFDAAILATGFQPDLRPLLPDARGVLDSSGEPLNSGAPTAERGLFFCGAKVTPTGQIREIAIDAERIAAYAPALVKRS